MGRPPNRIRRQRHGRTGNELATMAGPMNSKKISLERYVLIFGRANNQNDVVLCALKKTKKY